MIKVLLPLSIHFYKIALLVVYSLSLFFSIHLRISLLFIPYILFNQYECVHSLIGVNIRQANRNEFPFVVPIKRINNTNLAAERDFLCTGIVVSNKFVLSVAHGLIDVPIRELEIVVGSIDIRSTRRYPLSKLITYSMWANARHMRIQETTNDISLLKVAEQLPNDIQAVVFSPMPYANLYGHEVVTAGWGRINGDYPSRFLQTVTLTLLDPEKCKRRLEKIINETDNLYNRFLCTAAKPFAFLRNGDSGGPLLFSGELIGINKATCPFPESNFHPKKVNLHTKLDYYRYFIVDVISNF